MNKFSNILLSIILVLVIFNILLTGSVALKQQSYEQAEIGKTEKFEPEVANAIGKKVIDMYNRQDHQALYALFNEKAKVKISHQQLENQLIKLHALFDDIEESALVNTVKLGEKAGELYYQLLFNVRVKSKSNSQATLTLSVISKNNVTTLYGLRLNAMQKLDD